jgi:dTDP-4-amino-4,6-dideoxygalactose transaminase
MGIVNLESTPAFVETNRRNYRAYAAGLSGLPGVSLLPFDDADTPNWQYVVAEIGPEFVAERDTVLAALRAENVLARRYFWPGCHRMKPYRELFPWANAHLPNTNAVAARVIVLPTGSAVTPSDIGAVCDVFHALSHGQIRRARVA